ncbi:glycosyltransferase family 4 protein [Rhodanobacter sp. B05]|uniref:glycosyltransferase family 4 protein n=1 Tax=Rhodanobacter sp. B05 TaxID=1945859 RepID=UPI0020C4D582|nr:glycosyltransferase family 4 protein [Rhodanobacter sp. B05]
MLLNLSAWIRGQPWLKEIYRHFPQPLRNKVSEKLASRASTQIKFRRTPKWGGGTRLPASPGGVAVRRHEFGAAAGVNVFAYARGQSGLGESARLYVRALLAEGYPVAVHNIDIDIPHGMDDTSLDEHICTATPYGVNLVFVNPDYLDDAIANIGRERLAGRHTMACWFWELEKFPEEWLPALRVVDEIMVSSGFIGEVIGSITDKPLLHVPLPVGDVDDSGLTRMDFGLEDDTFIFLNSFDFNSFLTRKNPFAVIKAFQRAFADGRPDVRLLIKSSNGHRHPDKLRELLNAAASDRRILVRDEVIDRNDVQALQRCADAYVSLHHAEGFGLGLAECMRQGKPVIATAWSGNMEFMTPENSCLVDYRLVPVGEGEYLHHVGQRWADPDIDHAAAYMRRLADDREFAARIGAQAAFDIRDKLSPHTAAERIIHRLEALSASSGAFDAAGTGSVTGTT